MPQEEKKTLQGQAKEVFVDVRNELIVQSANLYLVVRKVLMASLGAVALTAEEANEFVNRLVERGELAETDAQRLIGELRTQGRKQEEEASKAREELTRKASMALEESVETILHQFNAPDKAEIEELSRKIGALNDKVTALTNRSAVQE
jgi:poly(hydroxyalkanoate) granule-associated protein